MCPKGKKKLTYSSPVYSLMPERALKEAKTFTIHLRSPVNGTRNLSVRVLGSSLGSRELDLPLRNKS